MVPNDAGRGLILRGFSWNALAQMLSVALSVILTPLLLHNLGLARFGLFGLVQMIVVLLTSFDGGFGSTAARYFATYASRADAKSVSRLFLTLVLMMLVLGGGLGLVLIASWRPLALMIGLPRTALATANALASMVAVIVLLALVQSVFTTLVQGHQHYNVTARANIGGLVVWSLGAVVAIRTSGGVVALSWALLAQQTTIIVLQAPMVARCIVWREVRLIAWPELRELLAFTWRRQLLGISVLVNSQFDGLLIAAILPLRDVGLYTAGANFASQVRSVVANALSPVGNDLTYVFGQNGAESAATRLASVQRLWVASITGYYSVATASAYFAVVAWLGSRYASAAVVAVVLIGGQGLATMASPLTLYLTGIGRAGPEAAYGGITVLLNVLCTVPLALAMGLYGVVAGTAIGAALGALAFPWLASHAVPIRVPHFVSAVRWGWGAAAAIGTLAVLEVTKHYFPSGAPGLIVVGLVAVAMLGAYGLAVFSRPIVASLSRRAPRALGGRGVTAQHSIEANRRGRRSREGSQARHFRRQ